MDDLSAEAKQPQERPSRGLPVSAGRQVVFWFAGLILFVFVLYVLRAVLLPFAAGMAIAYLLDPIADWLTDKGLSRTLATTVIIFSAALIFIAAFALVLKSTSPSR